MRLQYRYGTLVDAETGSKAWRPTRVVDDILGLRSDPSYTSYLTRRYAPFFAVNDPAEVQQSADHETLRPEEVADALVNVEVSTQAAGGLYHKIAQLPDEERRERPDRATRAASSTEPPEGIREAVDSVERFLQFVAPGTQLAAPRLSPAFDQLRERFVIAVEPASHGRLDSGLAADLSRVTWISGGELDIVDLPALGAWCFVELLRQHGPLAPHACAMCGFPWLGERGAKYCKRPAPDHLATCQAVAAQSRFRKANPAYHRERKRLYERVRRGTLKRGDYEGWRQENAPGVEGKDWQRFEAWKPVTKRTKRSTASKTEKR